MSCETCKNKSENLTEETKAIRGASEMAQRYKLLCGAVVALVIGFVVMTGCMVYAVTNAQRIANEAVLEALYAVSEIETTTETTTVTQDTGDGSGNNVYQAGEYATYDEGGGN